MEAVSMEDERWSSLPPHIIHEILGFLGSMKEAVKVCLVSKSWQAAWLSNRFLDFNEVDFSPSLSRFFINNPRQGKHIDGIVKEFHKFVEKTMRGVREEKIRLHRFNLRTSLVDTETAIPLIASWVDVALDAFVQEVSIDIRMAKVSRVMYMAPELLPTEYSQWSYSIPERVYSIPERVLSNSSLKSLTLLGRDLSLPEGAIVNLSSLQSLELNQTRIDQLGLERLFKGCPLLECLVLQFDCYQYIPEIRISNNSNLKRLKVNILESCVVDLVQIEAPLLETFCYNNENTDYDDHHTEIVVVGHNRRNLKYLEFNVRIPMSEEWFFEFLSKFSSLETLKLRLDKDVKRIKISNHTVKRIDLTVRDMEEIEIDCPMLLSLQLIARTSFFNVSIPSLSVINHHANFQGHIYFTYYSHVHFNASRFRKMSQFHLPPRNVKLWFFICSSDHEDIKKVDDETLPTSAFEIEQLNLLVRTPESCYSSIMDGFLSACHPTTIHVHPAPMPGKWEEQIDFVKFFKEKLENWNKGADEKKCWKHQLKDVKMEEMSSVEDEDPSSVDDDDIIEDLPDIITHPRMCVTLQWY